MRCLAKHPADRFESAEQLAEAIRQASVKHHSSKSPIWKTTFFRKSLVILASIVVVAGIIAWAAMTIVQSPENASKPSDQLVFDGLTRLITPLEREIPITLEAWVFPEKYENRCHFVVGSDVPSHYGLGLGICGVLLSAEYIEGILTSQATVPLRQWSHIAVVFSASETRLYLNGKLVESAAASKDAEGSHFVIGNVGENNPIDFFLGQIRQVRISRGEVYVEDFKPEENLKTESVEPSVEVIAMYEPVRVENGLVPDKSGHGWDARLDRLGSVQIEQ